MNMQWMKADWFRAAAVAVMVGGAAGCATGVASSAAGQAATTAPPAATAPAATPTPTEAEPTATPTPAVIPTLATTSPAGSGTPTAAAAPTLGLVWGPGGQEGYGAARPVTVFNGGDPTGLVQHITWSSWGGPMATGTGTAEYVAPSQSIAQGTAQPATIVAFDLGTCGGHPAYQAIEWFFPQHGGTFRATTYINDCTGTYVGSWS